MASVLLAASTYLTNLLTKRDVKLDEIDTLVKKAYEYSGLDPEEFYIFVTNMNMFKHHMDPGFLYKALLHLENVGIMTEFHEDIHELVKQIGYFGEKQVMNASINTNTAFHPKYLNSRL